MQKELPLREMPSALDCACHKRRKEMETLSTRRVAKWHRTLAGHDACCIAVDSGSIIPTDSKDTNARDRHRRYENQAILRLRQNYER